MGDYFFRTIFVMVYNYRAGPQSIFRRLTRGTFFFGGTSTVASLARIQSILYVIWN